MTFVHSSNLSVQDESLFQSLAPMAEIWMTFWHVKNKNQSTIQYETHSWSHVECTVAATLLHEVVKMTTTPAVIKSCGQKQTPHSMRNTSSAFRYCFFITSSLFLFSHSHCHPLHHCTSVLLLVCSVFMWLLISLACSAPQYRMPAAVPLYIMGSDVPAEYLPSISCSTCPLCGCTSRCKPIFTPLPWTTIQLQNIMEPFYSFTHFLQLLHK